MAGATFNVTNDDHDFVVLKYNISNVNTPGSSHGTACAGIIGALRNNDKGISGIAGGNLDGEASRGVQLFSMRLFDGEEFVATTETLVDAIVEGAVSNGGYGYGLRVQNHSWSTGS